MSDDDTILTDIVDASFRHPNTITGIRAKKFVAALALTTFPTGHRVPSCGDQ
jgi:hypothetical protein